MVSQADHINTPKTRDSRAIVDITHVERMWRGIVPIYIRNPWVASRNAEYVRVDLAVKGGGYYCY